MRLRNVVPFLMLTGCSGPPPPPAGAGGDAFSERTVVFLLADSTRTEALRTEIGEDEFYTVMDDMLWYRAEAWRWFEEHGIPVVSFEGRPPLSFRVAGEYRDFDFAAHPTLDVVVLYDRDREPRPVAPIDAPAEAEAYYDAYADTHP